MDERLRFVARLLDGEKMAVLCRALDISRKTGHKIFNRYKEVGLEGLTDRSRRPYRQANRFSFQIEALMVQMKKEHPSWGACLARLTATQKPGRNSEARRYGAQRGVNSTRRTPCGHRLSGSPPRVEPALASRYIR